jgi:HAE1 family hydrophobic/amphiphilic exporter-1
LLPIFRPSCRSLLFAPNGGLVAMLPAAGGAGRGHLRRFPVHAAGPGKNTLSDLDRVAHQIVNASHARKDLTGVTTTFSANDPQELVTIDREKAKALNIPLSQITTTLGVFMGSEYINDFDYNNRTYRVFVQADSPSA